MDNKQLPAMPSTDTVSGIQRYEALNLGMTKYEVVLKDILCAVIASKRHFIEDELPEAIKATDKYFAHLKTL